VSHCLRCLLACKRWFAELLPYSPLFANWLASTSCLLRNGFKRELRMRESIYEYGTGSYNGRGLIQIMRFDRFLGLRAIASTCLILVAPIAYAAVSYDQAAIQWLRQHAVPLQTVEAGHGFTDLQPLGQMVGNARIVELGEATHGTREFFQLKHRLVEFLASQKGFTIFSIEANMRGLPAQ
jgi:hypothetical protein